MISTITAASGTFESSLSSVLTLYTVQAEDVNKSSGLFEFPMPMLDSNGKIIMDLMGASREITVEGIVTTDDVGEIYKYARDIVGLQGTAGVYNTLISGVQGGAYGQFTYASYLLSNNISVVVSESSCSAAQGDPNSRRYSITMIEYGTLV